MKKIDLGCGNAKRDKESIGVDAVKLPGVDFVCDIDKENYHLRTMKLMKFIQDIFLNIFE